jgi:hypothetical protein
MTDITITGTADVIRRLNAYSLQLGDLVIKNALSKGALLLRNKLKQAAPVSRHPSAQFPAGRLKNSLFFKLSHLNKRNVNGSIGYYIRPRAKSGAGKRYGNQKNAYYAQFVEEGYEAKGKVLRRTVEVGQIIGYKRLSNGTLKPIRARSRRVVISRADARFSSNGNRSGRKSQRTGKHIPGTHFMKKTFESNKSVILQIIMQYVEVAGGQLARRHGL